ncbi:MAG: aminoacyl-tRNA hydrolase [Candidatus Yanofskybacteria bacterium]|nr:aminoacyl-tRNA hydrolase [Candidatus Yanofskybacteria bacterium]
MSKTKLIVGLGNPGSEYEKTRHNVGFLFLDYLAPKTKADAFAPDEKEASLTEGSLALKTKTFKLVLAKPQAFMNASGPVVASLMKKFKLKPEDVIVVQDDLDIPFENVKLSFDKNSAGHRGIESIIKSLKTKKFYRLRIGTQTKALQKVYRESTKKKDELVKDFVLKKFTPGEQDALKNLFPQALDRLLGILHQS